MPKIEKRSKALSVSPLKSSQTIGAALAFLGFNRAMPMLHGSQGCTAFGKVFFVRHFREPIPLQTSAMDQVSAVMGADDNVTEGIKTICEKSNPSLLGVPTTGLAETQGCDVKRAIYTFREKYPEYNHIPVVPVATPDFTGCLETGFASAVAAIFENLVPLAEDAGTKPGQRKKQVTVITSSQLTPGDLEQIREIVEMFGLRPVLVPDLSDSLDGRLTDQDFSPLTIGGTTVDELQTLGMSTATLVIGPSMYKAADILHKRTGVPDYRFDHLMGLDAVDEFVQILAEVSGEPVPEKLERQRAQLQDAMLDTHFMLGMTRVAIASDPDLLNSFSHFMSSMGCEVVAAVAPGNAPAVKKVAAETVKLGDLEELEKLARTHDAEILISNSHAVESAERLGIPILRAGFPQYDLLGGYQKVWVGYQGSRQTLFDLANILLTLERGEIHPYRSIYAQKPEYANDIEQATENTGLRH